MTGTENPLPRAPRARSLQDDLLQDCAASPRSPAPLRYRCGRRCEHRPPQPVRGAGTERRRRGPGDPEPVDVAAGAPDPGRPGIEVSAGPLRLSLAVVDR